MSEYRRATRPLNSAAVQAANDAVAPETGGRRLTNKPEDADLRKKWMDAYIKAGGKYEVVKPSGKKPKDTKQPCTLETADLCVTIKSDDDKVIEGATVEILGPESRTDTTNVNGVVLFQSIKPGSYTVTGSKAHFSTETTSSLVSASTTNSSELKLTRSSFYFAIYYSVPDKAFERAAKTWKSEIEGTSSYHKDTDVFMMAKAVKTEGDFKNEWKKVYKQSKDFRVVEGQLFTHASKDDDPATYDGLEFKPDQKEDGTLTKKEVASLPKLNWDLQEGELILSGCNTGLKGDRGFAPAESFAKSQGVKAVGQAGYAYFSKEKTNYVEIDASSTKVYLWAYKRGKNGLFGNGTKMEGIIYKP